MRTLEIIAGRTGRPVQHFLRGSTAHQSIGERGLADARVEELQALCLQHQFDKAIALGVPLLEHPLPPTLEARISANYVGQPGALDATGRGWSTCAGLRRSWKPSRTLVFSRADWEASASG